MFRAKILFAERDGSLKVSKVGEKVFMGREIMQKPDVLVVSQPLVACLPQSHPLARASSVGLDQLRGEPLVVIGQEAPWFKPAPDLSRAPSGPFRMCLSHTPDNLPWARANKIDLMLEERVLDLPMREATIATSLLIDFIGFLGRRGLAAETV